MYTDLSAALARAKERSGATTADDVFLTEILNMSAGAVGEAIHFRPFFAAAYLLEQNRSIQGLSEAKQVKFTGQKVVIASLLQLQAAYDTANGLTVPEGFEAIATTAATQSVPRYGTQSLKRKSTP